VSTLLYRPCSGQQASMISGQHCRRCLE
jgi:hypothetical protein